MSINCSLISMRGNTNLSKSKSGENKDQFVVTEYQGRVLVRRHLPAMEAYRTMHITGFNIKSFSQPTTYNSPFLLTPKILIYVNTTCKQISASSHLTAMMKLRLLLLIGMVMVGGEGAVKAGPLPHFFVQNYTTHMQLLDAHPMDHPI